MSGAEEHERENEIVEGNYCETSRKEIHIHGLPTVALLPPSQLSLLGTMTLPEMSYGSVSRERLAARNEEKIISQQSSQLVCFR